MAKETFYFSHDYYARQDPKLKKVAKKYGMAGIGAYWCIVEMLYEQNGHLKISDIPDIAEELALHPRTVLSLVKNFDLFQLNDGSFSSLSVIRRITERLLRSDSARKSALSRWKTDANAMRTQCDGNAIKESKVKESKGNEISVIISGLAYLAG